MIVNIALCFKGVYCFDDKIEFKSINCTETTCLLNVIGIKCYAKFEYYPDPNFYSVNCGSYDPGYYNISVPCDSLFGEPVVSCFKIEDKKGTDSFYISLILVGTHIIIPISLFGGGCLIFYGYVYYSAKTNIVSNDDETFGTNFVELDEKNSNEI